MIEYTAFDIALIPVIVGLVSLAKQIGLPSKAAPVLALVLGVAAGCLYVADGLREGILVGVTIGLAASGLYSGGKVIANK